MNNYELIKEAAGAAAAKALRSISRKDLPEIVEQIAGGGRGRYHIPGLKGAKSITASKAGKGLSRSAKEFGSLKAFKEYKRKGG
jgi:hypothetical protein